MESIKSMFADVLNEVLQCEMDEQLGYDKHERTESGEEKKNYRNGSTKRKLKTQLGEVEISVPRDRNGEYEPKIIDKYQRNADGLEDKILSLYAHGMSTRDIQEQIKDLYNIDVYYKYSQCVYNLAAVVNNCHKSLRKYHYIIYYDIIRFVLIYKLYQIPILKVIGKFFFQSTVMLRRQTDT